MRWFTDGSDLEGIQNAEDIEYMRLLRRALLAIGAWPGKRFGEDEKWRLPLQIVNIIESMNCLVLGTLYVRDMRQELTFIDLGQTYITIMLSIVCISRAVTIMFRKFDGPLEEFIRKIHLFNHKDRSEHAYKIHIFIHKISHFFTTYSIVLALFVWVFFNLTPSYNNINNGGFTRPLPENFTYEQSVYYALPFDYIHNFKGFLIIYIMNWFVTLLCGMLICFADCLLALIVFHLYGHLKILLYDLENFPRPAKDASTTSVTAVLYSDEEMEEVSKRLKSIVAHHRLILSYSDVVSDTFGFTIAIYYAFHQISGCLLLLECSTLEAEALVKFAPLTIGLTELLIQMSVIFELLGSMTDPLIRAAYSVPWECMDKKNRKLVMMLLRQTQIPLGLKAIGVVEVGCQTMAAILKTTVSYFMMLRTIAV